MPERFCALGAGEIAVHREGEREEDLAVLADIKVILLLVFFPAGKLLKHQGHVIADRIVHVIDTQLPEIGEPSGLIVLYPVIFGQPLLIQGIEGVPDRV